MAQKQTKITDQLRRGVLRLTRIYFVLIAIYALYIIVADAWNLVTPQIVLQRWSVAVILLVLTTLVWYIARLGSKNVAYYRILVFMLIVMGILFATFTIYTQRGMASRGVILYVIPIASSLVLLSRSALFATTGLCIASYILATVRYFIVHPGEGYKAELYGEVGFYCAILLVIALILWAVVRSRAAEKISP